VEHGAVHAILVPIQLLNEISLLTPAAARIKDVCCRVGAASGCNKHLVPDHAALNDRTFFKSASIRWR
jgi:hypothetical protein